MMHIPRLAHQQHIYRWLANLAILLALLPICACNTNQRIDASGTNPTIQEKTKTYFQLAVFPTMLVGSSTTFTCRIHSASTQVEMHQLSLQFKNVNGNSTKILYQYKEITTLLSPALGELGRDIVLALRSKGSLAANEDAAFEISLWCEDACIGKAYVHYYVKPAKDLLEAATRGDIDGIKKFLLKTPNINQLVDQDRNTALHLVMASQNSQALKLLLEDSRLDIEAKNNVGNAPLHLAAAHGNSEMIELLLQNKANVKAKNNEEASPLHMAAAFGNQKAMELLLPHSDINGVDINGNTPLHLAIASDNIEAVQFLLQQRTHATLQNNHQCNTPLHLAAMTGNIGILKLLLPKQKDVSVKNQFKNTPLHLAVGAGKLEAVQVLLDAGANIHATNIYGNSPLHQAAVMGDAAMIQFLLAQGANPQLKNDTGETPLQVATAWGHQEAMSKALASISQGTR